MNALTQALIRHGINATIDKPTEYIVDKILKKKGQLCTIKYIRPLHLKKPYAGSHAFKTTQGVFQVGVKYDNKNVVISGRESGDLPPINAGLSGRSWIIPNYFILGENNKILVRLYNFPNAIKHVSYELNGVTVSDEIIKPICLASEFRERDKPITAFDVELEYIAEVTP